jgi:DnaJ domain
MSNTPACAPASSWNILIVMKLTSKYFDSIRVKGRRDTAIPEPERHPGCQWKGCEGKGSHKAPMGRGRDGEYYHFCVDHVRQYNASYNYFDGMSDKDVADFQKDALTGHRPTWKVAANAGSHGNARAADPHEFFAWRARKAREAPTEHRRGIKPLERKALDSLHLTEVATREEIKAKFKELVKLHHPDANGGDKRSEDKLRDIIQAYNYLKQAGLV